MLRGDSGFSLRMMGLFYTPHSAMTAQAQTLKGLKSDCICYDLTHSLMQKIYTVTPQEHTGRGQENDELNRKERKMLDGPQGS